MFRRQKLSEAQVYETLKTVKYPGYTRDIVSFGLVKSVQVHGQDVDVVVQMTTNQQDVAAKMQQATEEALRALPGIGTVQVAVRLKEQGPAEGQTQPQAAPNVAPLPGVQNILAVASGKGGVGKSTVATNVAVALSMAGLRTGLLDADIYGPSIPLMMGVHDKPQGSSTHRIIPFLNHGVKMQSLGFFLGENAPVIFRRGGGQKESERLGIPLLGRVPLDPEVCDAGDTGVPVAIGQPDTKAGAEFHKIAATVVEILSQSPRRAAVRIIN